MLHALIRFLTRTGNALIAVPIALARFLFGSVLFNAKLGRLRLLLAPVMVYVVVALAVVYIYAPVRGVTGHLWMGKVLAYADERSSGTAIFDAKDRFVGVLDPLLDSQEDFNYTGRPIKLPDYIAYPDHKSLHVAKVPEDYWLCLRHLEDRHLGGLANPFGIDLFGILRAPVSAFRKTISSGAPAVGGGGSTIAMQLARIFFKTPPSANENLTEKVKRKLREWWLAPVIHWRLTYAGDDEALKRWAANHFPLAQRTGGQTLYGIAQTSLVVFGKPVDALSTAELYLLAAAVNRPIIVLPGSTRLNALRTRNWRHLALARAPICANALIEDVSRRFQVLDALTALGETLPDAKIPPALEAALRDLAPRRAPAASASTFQRANTLIPAAKYAVREELKTAYGYDWRSKAGSVRLTLDVTKNLRFRKAVQTALGRADRQYGGRLAPGYSLDAAEVRRSSAALKSPDVVLAAANAHGEIVRYYEANYTAAYFGAPVARDRASGRYDPARETRTIASVAKMLAAVAIANGTPKAERVRLLDVAAPKTGLESCRSGGERRLREAKVVFACSLNRPIEARLKTVGRSELRALTKSFGLTLPDPARDGTDPARAIAVGHIAGSPRAVQQMAAIILAALQGRGGDPVAPSHLLRSLGTGAKPDAEAPSALAARVPDDLIRPQAHEPMRTWLSAPICNRYGTLSRLGRWCAERRSDVTLHFAKTGTRGLGASRRGQYGIVDLWTAGGIAFEGGASYSYVMLVGTGGKPWARRLGAGSLAAVLLPPLLESLRNEAEALTAAQPVDLPSSSEDDKG